MFNEYKCMPVKSETKGLDLRAIAYKCYKFNLWHTN